MAAPIQVVAGVLRDARGKILLARRTEGRDLAGAWEFPGGKVEAGETTYQALKRELFEELGVEIGNAEALISVPQRYASKSILLEVFTIESYVGKPKGREQQALAWSPLEKLGLYPMPPADKPVVAALTLPNTLAITPEYDGDKHTFISSIERQLDSGIRLIQLRPKMPDGKMLKDLAIDIRTLCHSQGAALYINESITLAKMLDCPVHLKSRQLMQADIQSQLSGHPFSVACHSLDELKRAETMAALFALLGPVLKTKSHPEAEGIGWGGFRQLRNEVSLPIFALGGVAAADIADARKNGAQGVAGITGFWPAQV